MICKESYGHIFKEPIIKHVSQTVEQFQQIVSRNAVSMGILHCYPLILNTVAFIKYINRRRIYNCH